MDIFIGKIRFENYSASTVNQYQRFLADLLVYAGKSVQEITGEDVVECLNYYEQARKISSSIRDHKRCIANSFFTFLHEQGYISRNPMSTVDPIKYIVETREALISHGVEKLCVTHGTDIRDSAILELFLAGGCRISEAVSTRVEDMDLQAGCGKILGKRKEERMIFFNDRATECLERYLRDRKSGAVILSKRALYQGLKKNTLENTIRKIARKAGLGKRIFPHLLRHVFATRTLNKGMPLPTLCGLMGRSSAGTTRMYAKNSVGEIRYERDMHAIP